MSQNVAQAIAEDLLRYNPFLKNQVRIIRDNDLPPGNSIQAPVFEAVAQIPPDQHWSIIQTVDLDDLADIYKRPAFDGTETSTEILRIILAAAVIKEMKTSISSYFTS